MELNKDQQHAIDANAQDIIVRAGPGSGKTTVLVERVRRMIRDGIDPNDIAVVTFTNKGARQLEDRLKIDLGFVGTIHALCLRLVRAVNEDTVVISPEVSQKFMEEVCKPLKVSPGKVAKMRGQWDGQAEIKASTSKETIALTSYYKKLRSMNMIDYDGLLVMGRDLLPLGLHLMVDEFQDTSDLEMRIYDSSLWSTRFFVGDPDQQIYEWRGTDPLLFNKVWRSMREGPDSIGIEMMTNYRCSPKIQTAANMVVNPKACPQYEIPDVMKSCLTVTDREMSANDFHVNETVGVLARYNSEKDAVCEVLKGLGVEFTTKSNSSPLDDLKKVLTGFVVDCDPMLEESVARVFGAEYLSVCKGYAIEQLLSLKEVVVNSDVFKQIVTSTDKTGALKITHLLYGRDREDMYKFVMSWLLQFPEDATFEDILAEIEQSDVEDDSGRVQVLTVHQAKGLEFDKVILPNFSDETFPIRGQEDRRLLFVAITRARKQVLVFKKTA